MGSEILETPTEETQETVVASGSDMPESFNVKSNKKDDDVFMAEVLAEANRVAGVSKSKSEEEVVVDGKSQEQPKTTSAESDNSKGEDALDENLVTEGLKLGVYEADSRKFKSNEALRIHLDLIKVKAAQITPAPVETPVETPVQAPVEVKPFEHGLDPELNDPEMISVIERLEAHFTEQIAVKDAKITALASQVGNVTTSANDREQVAYQVQIDNLFEGLEKSHGDLFGKGKTSDFMQGSNSQVNRQKVYAEMNLVNRGCGGTMAVPELFQRSVRTAFADRSDELARSKITKELKKREGQIVSRPVNRNGTPAPKTTVDRQVQIAQEFIDAAEDDGGRAFFDSFDD